MRVVWIGVAGFFGAIARHGVGTWASRSSAGLFPWGTFAVNVIGSFALGLLLALTFERVNVSDTIRLALTVGFLGAFTTFSAFSLETMELFEQGETGLALANIAASVVAAVAAVSAGTWLGRAL